MASRHLGHRSATTASLPARMNEGRTAAQRASAAPVPLSISAQVFRKSRCGSMGSGRSTSGMPTAAIAFDFISARIAAARCIGREIAILRSAGSRCSRRQASSSGSPRSVTCSAPMGTHRKSLSAQDRKGHPARKVEIRYIPLHLTYWPSSPSDQLSPDPAKVKIARTHTRNSLKVNFVWASNGPGCAHALKAVVHCPADTASISALPLVGRKAEGYHRRRGVAASLSRGSLHGRSGVAAGFGP